MDTVEHLLKQLWDTTRRRLGAIFASVVLAFVAVRLGTILLPYITFDGNNYLTTMWTLFTEDFTGLGLRRPWLVGVFLWPLHQILDPELANRILAIVSALGFGVPLYLLYNRVSREWLAGVATVLTVLFSAYAGMINWGYITFFGLTAYYFAIWLTLETLEHRTKRKFTFLTISYSLVFYAHQITALYLVASVTTFFVLVVASNPNKWQKYAFLPIAGVAGTILAIPVLPVYFRIALAATGGSGGSARTVTALLRVFDQIITFVLRIAQYRIIFVFLITLILYGLWRASKKDRILIISIAAIAIPSLTILLHSAAPRMLYFWPPIGAYVILIALNDTLDRPNVLADIVGTIQKRRPQNREVLAALRTALVLSLILFTAMSYSGYMNTAESSHEWYQTLTPEQAESLDWIRSNTNQNATFATSHKAVGWAIEGFTRRNAFEPQGQKNYMKQYAYPEQRRQAQVQDRIFSRNIGLANGNVRASLSAPYNSNGNPTFDVNTGNYRTFSWINDSLTTVTLQAENGRITRNLSTATKIIETKNATDGSRVTVTYTWEGNLTVKKRVIVPDSDTKINVYLTATGKNQIVSTTVPIIYSNQLWVEKYNINESSITVAQHNGFGMVTESTVTTSNSDIKFSSNYTNKKNPAMIVQSDGVVGITIDYSLNRQPTNSLTEIYHVPTLISEAGVDYIVAMEYAPSEEETNFDRKTIEWFRSSPYYETVYEKNYVIVFRAKTQSITTDNRIK